MNPNYAGLEIQVSQLINAWLIHITHFHYLKGDSQASLHREHAGGQVSTCVSIKVVLCICMHMNFDEGVPQVCGGSTHTTLFIRELVSPPSPLRISKMMFPVILILKLRTLLHKFKILVLLVST